MAKKKNKIGLFDLLMMLMALVGLVLAVVGICIPFFRLNVLGQSEGIKLFAEGLADGDFPIATVQAFAIVSLVFTAIAAALVLLGKLGVIRFKGLFKLLLAIATIVFAALVITFAATYAAQYDLTSIGNNAGGIFGGILGGLADLTDASFVAAFGAYLVMGGGVVSGVALLVSRLK